MIDANRPNDFSSLSRAIADYGYYPPETVIMDGEIRRFATDPRKKHSKDGWYIGFDDASGRAGAFGSWRENSKITWSGNNGRQLSATELASIDKKRQEAETSRRKAKSEAVKQATLVFQEASESGTSDYLNKKGIDQPVGTRFVTDLEPEKLGFKKGKPISGLLVPITSPTGDKSSLQLILDDGTKLFMKGGSTAGGWFGIGEWQDASTIVIAEGVATAQSIYQCTGLPVLAAFSANNLEKIAQMARKKNAQAEILLAVDGDDAGRSHSEKAVKGVGGRLISAPDSMDWNDVHVAGGVNTVRQAFSPISQDSGWRSDLIVKHKPDGTQIVQCRVHNLVLILKHATEFKHRIRYNEFINQIAIEDENLDEPSLYKIKAALEKNHINEKLPTKDLEEAIQVVANENKFHPIRTYLQSLVWDGVPRAKQLFTRYFGAEDNDYTAAVSLSLLISAIARVMKPACKVDTMVVLEGEQGSFKSTAIIELFSQPWHSETLASVVEKDFYQNLSGKWIMEFGEMSGITRADSDHIKQVLTNRTDRYRPSYGKCSKDFPRQNIFIGTTNNATYLKDATGARRYLPIACTKIDLDSIIKDRDLLWAEAFVLYKEGATWWEIPGASDEQEKRYDADESWEEKIAHWLIGKSVASAGEILEKALGIEVVKHGKSELTRVGNIMKRFNWKKKNDSVGGQRVWRYHRF